jgi:hypothetical protein
VIDFQFITPRLATGTLVSSYQDIEQLAYAGITHSIDLTWKEADQSFMASYPGIAVLWNPTDDDGQYKPPVWFGQSINFAFMALALPHTKIYCHCKGGLNRGPSTAFAIMLALGWDFDVALDLIHQQRPATYGWVRYAVDAANAVKELGYV